MNINNEYFIDFHSHILPNLDDGSKGLEMSIDMLKLSKAEGVKYICATSHYIPDEVFMSRDEYERKLFQLEETIRNIELDIQIIPGLELYMHPELPRLYREKKIWALNYGKYMLIELPMQQVPLYTEDVLYELRLEGVVPIIAHPERNFAIMKNYKLLQNLIEQGALAQVNAGSLRGIYGKEVKNFAEKLVERNLIHIIGSDGHEDKKRTTKIRSGYEAVKEINQELYQWIMENQYKLIEGADVDVLPIEAAKKKLSLFTQILHLK